MKVYITRVIPEVGVKLLEEKGYQVFQFEGKTQMTQEQLIETCQHYDALLSAGPNKLDRVFFQKCKHLKGVALYSVGYDNLDVKAAKEVGVQVGNTPGVLSNASADIAFLLMLAVSRNAMFMHHKILKGEWGFYEPTANLGTELYGKTLGILGLGRIGFEMAKRCTAAYGMKVIYHNRNKNEEAERTFAAKWVSFEDLLAQSDVVSVHANLSAETLGLFNYRSFSKMKSSAIFVNTARGGIHVEEDLIQALRDGEIWGAGLDVTNPEPMDKNNPLLTMTNVCVVPHIGSATKETRDAMAVIAANNIIASLEGKPMTHPIL